MKMHFGQLHIPASPGQKKQPDRAGLPSWIPPAHIIPLIDRQKRDRDKRRKRGPPAGQPRVEIDIDAPIPEQAPEDREEDDPNRGIMIIDLKA